MPPVTPFLQALFDVMTIASAGAHDPAFAREARLEAAACQIAARLIADARRAQ